MNWIDKYRQASFRGVPFFVPTAEHSGGRRTITHEFPGQDKAYTEDLGRSVRQFSIEAYVLGDDYFTARDAVLNAVESAGPGILVHPYLGEINVNCTRYTLRESNAELRIARFTLAFTEAAEVTFPKQTTATQPDVDTKRGTALDKARAAFTKIYTLAGKTYTQVDNVADTAQSALDAIQYGRRFLSDTASVFTLRVASVGSQIASIIYDSGDLFDNFAGLLNFGNTIDDLDAPLTNLNARDRFDQMRTLLNQTPAAGYVAGDPADLYSRQTNEISIINAMGLVVWIDYASYQEAVETLDLILAQFETIITTIDDREYFQAMHDLRAAVMDDISIRVETLPQRQIVTPQNTTNSLDLSYSINGNLAIEQNIIDRNNIVHPAFIAGGVPIEVIPDV